MSDKHKQHELNYQIAIEEYLNTLLPEEDIRQSELIRAMRYSLLAGGKRIRPILVLEFCRICGGNVETVLPFACAVEMVHTYSLIHDDLPCMDNDDLRRGRPSNHKVFGEDIALLAGDALLTFAFETMLSPEAVGAVGAQRAAAAAGILASAAGAYGMVGGQVIDLKSEGTAVSLETLKVMDECKTGALIAASAKMGCVLSGADEKRLAAAEKYAQALGLAFQIVDDILDVTGDTKTLGKPVGSDTGNDKSTYVSLLGLENAEKAAEDLTRSAVAALDCFGQEGEYLAVLAQRLAERQK